MNADFLLFATDAAQPNLILTVVALLAVFGLPCLMILLTRKVKFFKIVGAVALCYVLGFAFSLSGLNYDKSLVETVASVLVCIAIPLVLFGFEMKSLKRLAKKTAVSFGLVCVSAVVVATAAFLITKNFLPDAAGLTAMSIGLYIGGTPNLLAIGSAMLGTGHEAIVLANTADLFVGGLYFLFLLTAAKPVYSFVLDGKKRKKQKASDENTTENKVSVETATENSDVSSDGSARQDSNGEISPDDKRLLSVANEYDFSVVERNKKSIWRLVGVVALAVACFGVGVGLELLVNGSLAGSLFILVTVSVLGIAFSFVKPVRETKGSYQVGQYLILSFSLALSMSMDMSKLVSELLPVLLLFACLQIGGILLHMILCKIFKIDSDTALITSTAGVYGPPFITPVANAAKRNDLIAPGIICATLGLAIGNFIGIGVGQLFLLLM